MALQRSIEGPTDFCSLLCVIMFLHVRSGIVGPVLLQGSLQMTMAALDTDKGGALSLKRLDRPFSAAFSCCFKVGQNREVGQPTKGT